MYYTCEIWVKGLPKRILKDRWKPDYYPIRAALESKQFERVISTDSKEYAEVGKQYGADIPFIRPEELSSDTANSIDVVFHALDYLKDEF